jgi:hypothetical protein
MSCIHGDERIENQASTGRSSIPFLDKFSWDKVRRILTICMRKGVPRFLITTDFLSFILFVVFIFYAISLANSKWIFTIFRDSLIKRASRIRRARHIPEIL